MSYVLVLADRASIDPVSLGRSDDNVDVVRIDISDAGSVTALAQRAAAHGEVR
jgi:hypothetical protein